MRKKIIIFIGILLISSTLSVILANNNHPIDHKNNATVEKLVEDNSARNIDFKTGFIKYLDKIQGKIDNAYLKNTSQADYGEVSKLFVQPALVDEKSAAKAKSDAKDNLIKYSYEIEAGGLEDYSLTKFTVVLTNGNQSYLVNGKISSDGGYQIKEVISLPGENRVNEVQNDKNE